MIKHVIGGAVVLSFAAGCGGSESDCSDVSGTACTWAGMRGPNGFNGEGLDRQETQLDWPMDVSFAPDGTPWIVDWNSHRVRRVLADDTIQTAIGNGNEGDGDEEFKERLPLGDPAGAPGVLVSLNHPSDIDFMPDGKVIIASWHTNKVRQLDPETDLVTVLAGGGYGYTGDGGPAYKALFDLPKAIAIDEDGVIFVSDQTNQRIRAIQPDDERIIDSFAGKGSKGYSGDGGPAADAELNLTVPGLPGSSLELGNGYLYLADSGNNRIRRIHLETGEIDCIAGNGTPGNAGDGGPAIDAELFAPTDIEIGPDGRLYIADSGNSVIRAMDLETGVIEHIAGTGDACEPPAQCYEQEEGGPADELWLNQPYGIDFDADGNLFVADTYNNRIVRIAK